MTIVMGLDQHRAQITAEWIDTETGEIARARVAPAHREAVRRFLGAVRGPGARGRAGGDDGLAVRGRGAAGGRRAGASGRAGGDQRAARQQEAAEERPGGRQASAGAVDDRAAAGVLDRARSHRSISAPRSGCVTRWSMSAASGSSGSARCSTTTGSRTAATWTCSQRPGVTGSTELSLPEAAREQITVALADDRRARRPDRPRSTSQLRAYARRQTGCRALMGHYGIGELTSVAILAELGDCRRFSSSRYAVRYGGLDITVHASDRRRAPGRLSRQGPPVLRWALYEAAQAASRASSPDHDYYRQAAAAARAQPRLPRDRAQTPQTQLPHAQRTRRRRRSQPA